MDGATECCLLRIQLSHLHTHNTRPRLTPEAPESQMIPFPDGVGGPTGGSACTVGGRLAGLGLLRGCHQGQFLCQASGLALGFPGPSSQPPRLVSIPFALMEVHVQKVPDFDPQIANESQSDRLRRPAAAQGRQLRGTGRREGENQ